MEKSDFDKLLQRYLTDQVTEKEKIKIEAWLEVMKTDNPTDLELSKEDEEKMFQKITKSINEDDDVPQRILVSFRPWIIGIAATLIIASVSFILWNNSKKQDTDKLILNDGTLVWLKSGSKLIYAEKNDKHIRYAELNGSALFEVTKDAARPFILKCGDFTMKVLGTSFNVRPTSSSIELEVLTGTVNISSFGDSVGINVTHNQKVIYTGKANPAKVELTEEEVSAAISHTEYDMRFKNEHLDKIIEKIEKKFDVIIQVDNSRLFNCKITADFTDHSLQSTLMMISEVLPVDYKLNGSTITLSGSGCK